MVSLPGLHLRRSLGLKRKTILVNQYVPKDHKDGLLFALPMRRRAETVYESGARGVVAPSTQVVDALGSYIHSVNGLVTPAQANKLRIGGAIGISSKRKGALFEAEGINKLLDSRAFDPASTAWAVNVGTPTVTSNTANGIDGALVADELEDNSNSLFESILQNVTIPDDSTWWTFFIHIRKDSDETRFPEVQFFLENGTIQSIIAQINTKTGAVATRSSTGTVKVYALDKGLYWKFVVSVKNNGTANTQASAKIFPAVSASLGGAPVAATVGSIIIDAAQLENKEYASTFVETGGAAVTRAKDDIDYDNTSEVNVKAVAGTIYIASTPQWEGTEGGHHWIFSIKTADDGVQFFHHEADGNARFNVSSGGASVASLNDGFTLTRGVTYVWALVWALNDFRLYRDGVLVASDDAGAAPTAMATRIYLGQNASNANQANANLAHFHSYDSAHATPRVLRNTREIQAWLSI